MTSSTLIVRTAARLLAPVIMVLSVYLLFRGHNAPGGGFIAALVASAALMLRFLAFGREDVSRVLPVPVEVLLGIGLLVAVGVGLLGYALEGAFLGGAIWSGTFPLIGTQKLTSSLFFDVGVYLVVVSVVAAVITQLGEDES